MIHDKALHQCDLLSCDGYVFSDDACGFVGLHRCQLYPAASMRGEVVERRLPDEQVLADPEGWMPLVNCPGAHSLETVPPLGHAVDPPGGGTHTQSTCESRHG